MDKRIGSTAGFLACVGLLVHSVSSSENAPRKAVNPEGVSGQAAPTAIVELPAKPAIVTPGPWRATAQYFGHTVDPARASACIESLANQRPHSCSSSELQALFGLPPTPVPLQFLLATIPDPLHTRLAIETDRNLDALQRAAFQSGWELATQWLPWTAAATPNGKDEHLPGLLVFRHHLIKGIRDSGELLLTFIVAETPTAGIDESAFLAAKQLWDGLAPSTSATVRIAGPTFSGSFQSLTQLLEQWHTPAHFEVHAGSVSNSEYADFLRERLGSRVEFHGSTMPSYSFEQAFAELVHGRFKKDEVVELNENETGFSFISDHQFSVYRYPRDIAQVRNAYNDTAFSTPNGGEPAAAMPRLNFSLKDTQAGEDMFPMFSTSHTPLSQNAELQATISYLKRRNIRVASLSATSVFDSLFLASLLTRSCPNVRIVLRSTDLLFVQEAAQNSLSGLLAISPFPLFAEGAGWSGANMHDANTFASSDQIGEYNAVLALLHGSAAQSQPYLDKQRAWLLELTPTGWLPVDAINRYDVPGWFQLPEPVATSHLPGHFQMRFGWIILCLTIAACSLSFCARLLYLQLRPDHLVWSNLCLADVWPTPLSRAVPSVVHHRYLCMTACFATLGLAAGLTLCPLLAVRTQVDGAAPLIAIQLAATALPFVIAGLLSAIVPVRIRHTQPLSRSLERGQFAPESAIMRAVIIGLPIAALTLWYQCCAADTAGFFLSFRALSLAGPVSPIWPLLLAAAGLFTLCYCHLRRFTWAYRRQPHLDTEAFDRWLCNEFSRILGKLRHYLYDPSSNAGLLAVPNSLILAVAAMAALVGVAALVRSHSFEPPHFIHIFEAMLIPLAVFSALSFARFVQCWGLARDFLVSANSVVLGRYFRRLPEFGGIGPVWLRDVKLLSLATTSNSAIALHNLAQEGLEPQLSERYTAALQGFLSLQEKERAGGRLAFIQAFDHFRQEANDIARDLGDTVLRPFWVNHKLPLIGEKAPAATAALPAETAQAAAASASGVTVIPVRDSEPAITEAAYAAAARYLALQYSVFIGYVLLHLQNLLLCSMLSFVLIVLALNSFIFPVPQGLFYFLIIILVAAAIVVLAVLAQMERDPVLSRLSGTKSGELNSGFYWRALSVGALPVLSVIGTQFPSLSQFFWSWLEPALSRQ